MVPEWEIPKDEFLRHLDCSEGAFEKKLELPQLSRVRRIIPLRHIKEITSAPIPISLEMLNYLISRMKTLDGREPFKNAELQLCKIDPSHLKIGQKFAYREVYQSLIEDLPALFSGYCMSTGLGDLGAYFIFGRDLDDLPALACYLPPILEQHGADLAIMDGIHRDYISNQMGQTNKAILIKNVSVPFPCGLHTWSDIKVIGLADKPKEITERYFELNKGLFRDLKYLGIDG